MGKAIEITHFSDVLCVWAYIAQVRVDELRANFPDDVRVRYRFLQVFGDVAGKMETQWSDRGGLEGYAAHVQEVAGQFDHVGINPDVWLRNTPASSMPAHVLLAAAKVALADDPQGADPEAVDRLLGALRRAFFVDAIDISRHDRLFEIAEAAGSDVPRLTAVIDHGRAHAALAADFAAATRHAVRSSPTMTFNEGRQTLAGNVGYRVLEANIRELLRRPGDQQSWC